MYSKKRKPSSKKMNSPPVNLFPTKYNISWLGNTPGNLEKLKEKTE